RDIHEVYRVVLQSRFAAVMSTQEWLDMLERGTQPERDSIYGSNQRARSGGRTVAKLAQRGKG
ncbi:MAG: cysteine hydrolase, partial [Gammaproteobacteria bacterium]